MHSLHNTWRLFQPTSIKTSPYGEYGQFIHVLDEILQIKKKFPQSRMTKIQLSWLHLLVTFPSWNTLEVHSIETCLELGQPKRAIDVWKDILLF